MEKSIKVIADRTPTDKEKLLVQMLADEKRPKDIAVERGVSRKTVEAQIFALKKKFNKTSVAGLISLFFRNKLIH